MVEFKKRWNIKPNDLIDGYDTAKTWYISTIIGTEIIEYDLKEDNEEF
jgi:hypothetical protein